MVGGGRRREGRSLSHCLLAEAHVYVCVCVCVCVCEQLAHDHYLRVAVVASNPLPLKSRANTLVITAHS